MVDSRILIVTTSISSNVPVIVRTGHHPAVTQLRARVPVTECDDLYEAHDDFDVIYAAIVDRVLRAAVDGDVVYAVPGSPSVGERTVPMLTSGARDRGIDVMVRPASSFLELAWSAVGIDPITHGVQVLDARELPDPLPLHLPTIVTQVDSRLRAGDLGVALGRLLDDHATVTVLDRLGDPDQRIESVPVSELANLDAGIRTSVYVPPAPVGLLGLVSTNRLLRSACPWDREQTHHSLLEHLIEEAYETADAIGRLPSDAPGGEADFAGYAEVEDELGDLLLQVVFHATLASEAGAFTIDDVAEQNRRKLVRRHPHVFGDVAADTADEVRGNWEQIKQDEKGRASLMDDIPVGMAAVSRALKAQKRASSVGFDWDDPEPIFAVLRAEIDEVAAATDPNEVAAELGDVIFSAINLARHLDVDPEAALRGSVDRFMVRFRAVEAELADRGLSVRDVSEAELDAAWSRAKTTTMGRAGQST